MATTPRRRPSRPRIEFQSFYAQVVDWRITYSLATGAQFREPAPYWEHAELVISVRFVAPSKVAGRTADLTFLGNRQEDAAIARPADASFIPNRVGTLHARSGRTSYLGSLPMSAMWGLAPVMAAGKVRIIGMHGQPLKCGEAAITSVNFEYAVDPDDLPTD